MNNNSLSSIFFFLLLTTTTAADDLVYQTCKDSSNGNPNIDLTFCVTSFESTSAPTPTSTSHMGLISLTLAKNNVTSTASFINKLISETNKIDTNTKLGLKDCVKLYSESITSLEEAVRDYKAKRFNDANVKISYAMDSSTTCEDGFLDLQVLSPLTKLNNFAFQLCAISLSIINMMLPH